MDGRLTHQATAFPAEVSAPREVTTEKELHRMFMGGNHMLHSIVMGGNGMGGEKGKATETTAGQQQGVRRE